MHAWAGAGRLAVPGERRPCQLGDNRPHEVPFRVRSSPGGDRRAFRQRVRTRPTVQVDPKWSATHVDISAPGALRP